MHKLINYHSFTKGLDSLSNLTGLHLSLYDDERHLVLVSTKQDPLLSVIKRHSKANKLYEDLADKNLKLALIRNEAFFMQSLTGQYHMFIPLHYKELTMIALAEAFYLTQGDFKIFYYGEHGRSLSLTERTLEEWLKELLILPSEKGTATMEDIQSVLEYLLASVYAVGQQDRYSIQSRTIVSLLSNINYNFTMNDIFQMVLDAVIFLFDADTAAIFLRKDCYFYPAVFGDKDTQLDRDLKIPEDNRFIADLLATERPVSVMDSHELLHAGFPPEIISMNLFPLSSNLIFFGVLGIFNSALDEETCDVIDDLCKLSAYLCSVRMMKEEYEHKYDELREVSTTTSSICALYQDTARLGDGIVNEASKLVDAEKCSLMLPRDKEILEVRAVKGVNRWLMENVKVRRGEGIAGRVYARGSPVLIDGEKMIREYGIDPRAHYKTSSCLSMPLMLADEIIGVLNLSDKRSGASFTQNDISMLTPFVLLMSAVLKLGSCHKKLEEAKKLSITDSLTGLFNRRYLDSRLEEEYVRAKRYNLVLSLAILDIDDFKLFNDAEGHLAGDHILKELARIMASSVRSHDILARFGGEEFAIIMPQTSKAEAFIISERIREDIRHHFIPTWKSYPKKRITICSGISTYPECGAAKEDIIRYADRALYKAKSLGKDRTVVWDVM